MLVDHIGMPQLRDMAKRSEQIAGEIRLADLPRLAGMLYPGSGARDRQIDVQIRFRSGIQGAPEISGTISGLLELKCQRCLGALEWPLGLGFRLAVVESEQDLEEMAEPFDTLMAGEHGIALTEVIEDEVLSSLPLAPAHESIADCDDAELLGAKIVDVQADVGIGSDEAVSETNQPFSDLAAMLKHGVDSDKADK
jgi:uncharacterized protein